MARWGPAGARGGGTPLNHPLEFKMPASCCGFILREKRQMKQMFLTKYRVVQV